MPETTTRRHFLQTAGALPVLATATPWLPFRQDVPGSRVRLSCNLYSFNSVLRNGEMSLEEVIEFCAELGFDAVDPTGYYFGTYPEVPPEGYTHQIKRRAFLLGLDVSGTGVRNDFTQPDAEARAGDVEHVKRWIPFAARLGAPVLRVFAGREDTGDASRETATGWLVDALGECAEYAGEYGVMIVLQNHAEFLKTADQVIDVLEAVDSDWLGLNLDIGSLPTSDPYDEIARAAPYAVTWQIKENVHRGREQEPTDLEKIAQIVEESGYRGYLPIETLGPGDPRKQVPRFLDEVRAALS